MAGINIGFETRKCFVRGEKGMFHMWIQRANVVPPSMMIGGGNGGQLWEAFGLVEFEDGHVREVMPTDVRFADGGNFNEVAFIEPKEE